jgi:hypothetical protein
MLILSISAPKFQKLDVSRSISPKEFISAPKTLEFFSKYFRVKLCNMTPKGQITKMIRMRSYYIANERKFDDDSKSIKIILFLFVI